VLVTVPRYSLPVLFTFGSDDGLCQRADPSVSHARDGRQG
jgi:hypothetical protein